MEKYAVVSAYGSDDGWVVVPVVEGVFDTYEGARKVFEAILKNHNATEYDKDISHFYSNGPACVKIVKI